MSSRDPSDSSRGRPKRSWAEVARAPGVSIVRGESTDPPQRVIASLRVADAMQDPRARVDISTYSPSVVAGFSLATSPTGFHVLIPGHCPFYQPLDGSRRSWNLYEVQPSAEVKYTDAMGPNIDPILAACCAAGEALVDPAGEPTADLVTYRNNLNKILKTPYAQRPDDAWRIDLHRLAGVVFMNVCPSTADSFIDADQLGRRFEKLMTREPDAAASTAVAHLEYCIVLRSQLGPHRIILSAELDCRTPPSCPSGPASPPPSAGSARAPQQSFASERVTVDHRGSARRPRLHDFIELKSSALPITVSRPSFKSMRWWIQSWLAGVPTIVCGVHNRGSISAADILTIPIHHLIPTPNTHQSQDRRLPPQWWHPSVCASFGCAVLSFVRAHTRDGRRYVLSFHPQSASIVLSEAPADAKPFLPRAFIHDLSAVPPTSASISSVSSLLACADRCGPSDRMPSPPGVAHVAENRFGL